MLQALFHAWERRLASITKDRVVRPFDWGLDWMPANGHRPRAPHRLTILDDWVSHVMADTDAFFTPAPTADYTLERAGGGRRASADVSERARHAASREQHRLLPPVSGPRSWRAERRRAAGSPRRRAGAAAVELRPGRSRRAVPAAGDERHERAAPQPAVSRSADAAGAAPRRLHRQRQRRADGAGVPPGGARRAAGDRLAGAARASIASAFSARSLGSCLSLLTTAHEPLIRAQALNHISPYFADVVWRGLSTRHVREGLDGHIELDLLRAVVAADQPVVVSGAACGIAQTLLVYARYDLTFPVDLSEELVRQFRELRHSARGRGAALRPLQHRQGAVQVRRRVDPDAVSEEAVGRRSLVVGPGR